MSKRSIIPLYDLFAVCDPLGNIVHTTVAADQQSSIDEWLEQEGACTSIANLHRAIRGESKQCRPSWEQFEARGYRIVSVSLIPKEAQ